MKKIVNINLVCGCGHTGSSIFSRIIGSHSKIFFPTYETNTFLLYNQFQQNILIKKLKKNCLDIGCEQILEKTNRHVWHVDYIRSTHKNVRFILITRNARDVIASLYKRNKYQNLNALKDSIRRYQDDSICTIRQIKQKDSFLVRYEDFINNPRKICTKVLKFLNLQYENNIMNYHKENISWNKQSKIIKTNGVGEKNHDLLRNWQINQKIYKNKTKWNEIINKKYCYVVDDFMDNFGNTIMKKLGY